MGTVLTAEDLWPLVLKLPHDEQVRLANLVLMAAQRRPNADREAYLGAPPAPEESGDDPLAWEGEGWESVAATK